MSRTDLGNQGRLRNDCIARNSNAISSIIRDVQAALDAPKAVFAQYRAILGVGLRNSFGMLLFCISNDKIKSDGVHQAASGSS